VARPVEDILKSSNSSEGLDGIEASPTPCGTASNVLREITSRQGKCSGWTWSAGDSRIFSAMCGALEVSDGRSVVELITT
jgi:hypothetical protein